MTTLLLLVSFDSPLCSSISSLVKFILWFKFSHRQKAGRGHGEMGKARTALVLLHASKSLLYWHFPPPSLSILLKFMCIKKFTQLDILLRWALVHLHFLYCTDPKYWESLKNTYLHYTVSWVSSLTDIPLDSRMLQMLMMPPSLKQRH